MKMCFGAFKCQKINLDCSCSKKIGVMMTLVGTMKVKLKFPWQGLGMVKGIKTSIVMTIFATPFA